MNRFCVISTIIFIINIPSIITFTTYHHPSTRSILTELFAISNDERPHEQRRTSPRKARRLNHSFQHLHRHDDKNIPPEATHLTPTDYLIQYGGYTPSEIQTLSDHFPPLLSLDVERHLKPNLKFLKYTLGGVGSSGTLSKAARANVPPHYYGARLERVIAPRHAFLVYHDLPSGDALLNDAHLFRDFLKPKESAPFAALCNRWRKSSSSDDCRKRPFTASDVDAFEIMFRRGLMSACRRDVSKDIWERSGVRDGGVMVTLLIRHGANPFERDAKGVSLLHWACGAGNIDAAKVLVVDVFHDDGFRIAAERDGATPLHWAAVGVGSKAFGIGGSYELCRLILDWDGSRDRRCDLINAVTKDGNSVLMWASWAGSLDIVKLLVERGADRECVNRNGCSVAHWAASGGSLDVCRYLKSCGVKFVGVVNNAGNSPLSHAVAYGRDDVVRWLCSIGEDKKNMKAAEGLAKDFIGWTEGDERRQKVLDAFQVN